jgi:hypothetical protein
VLHDSNDHVRITQAPVVLGDPVGWPTKAISIGVVVVVVLVMAIAWSRWQHRWRATPITSAALTEDPSRLLLELPTCNADHRQRVEESRTTVRVFVEHRRATTDDCADGLAVALGNSLGDRKLFDGADGRLLLDPNELCAPPLEPALLPHDAREVHLDPHVGGRHHKAWLLDGGFLEISTGVPSSVILRPVREVEVQGTSAVLGHRMEDEDAAVNVVSWTAKAQCGDVRVAVTSNAVSAEELVAIADSISTVSK